MAVAVTAFAITLTTAQAAHASPSATELTKQIEKQSQALEVVVESYNAMNVNIKKTQTDMTKLEASLAPAKAALATASAQVSTIASTAYQQGRTGPLTAVLGGNSDELLQKLGFLDLIQSSNQHDIDTYTETTQTFAERQAALKVTKDKQAAQLKELAARKKKIEDEIKDLKAKRTAAYGSPTEKGSAYTGKIPDVSGKAGIAVRFAYSQVGDSYGFGDSGPNSWDCSGLTMGAWKAAGVSLTHQASAQWDEVVHIGRGDLEPGDLVFYNNLAHVGIFVGNNQIIDAPTYGKPVDVRSINRGMPIDGYGRVKT